MKERLDVLLVSRGLAPSREKAKAYIMAGDVYVNGQKEYKAGDTFKDDCEIEVRATKMPFVSRGGYKLDKAIKVFSPKINGRVCLDIGASTGGFTDCMLQNGAKKVYSVDVGHGQLAWSLRNDERVICMEKTNFRYLTDEDFADKVQFAGCDVSFISLSKILPAAHIILTDDGEMVCLIKPQFEAGREQVGKHGVVKDKKVHIEVIKRIIDIAQKENFYISGLSYSPIKGPEGNIEYLIYLKKYENNNQFIPDREFIEKLVKEAHESL